MTLTPVLTLLWGMRGAPATGLMVHHALFLAVLEENHRNEGVICIPSLKVGIFTVWEAMSANFDYFRPFHIIRVRVRVRVRVRIRVRVSVRSPISGLLKGYQ